MPYSANRHTNHVFASNERYRSGVSLISSFLCCTLLVEDCETFNESRPDKPQLPCNFHKEDLTPNLWPWNPSIRPAQLRTSKTVATRWRGTDIEKVLLILKNGTESRQGNATL